MYGMGMPQESRYLSSREEVAQVFRLFRDQLSEVKLRFAGVNSPYTARVLDLEDNGVLLQNIVPRDGATYLREGTEFSISGRAEGLFVYVTGNKVDPGNNKDDAYFRISMPTSVLYQQRRRTERVRIPVQANVHRSHIRLGDTQPLYARILDISMTGARAEIAPARPNTLHANQQIENCLIHVPNQLSIDVDLMIRHADFNKIGQTMECGLELVNPTNEVTVRLKDFLTRITSNVF